MTIHDQIALELGRALMRAIAAEEQNRLVSAEVTKLRKELEAAKASPENPAV